MIRLADVSALLICLAVSGVQATAAQDAPREPRRIALTFDDVPVSGICDPARVRRVTQRLTEAIARRGFPSAALVTPVDCIGQGLLREVLARWKEIGATIGNHSHTHPDLNTTPPNVYGDDIRRAQERIDAAVTTETRWFRPPYLHTGDDRGEKEALDSYLETHGYRLAPVTVDNQEWVYAAVYEDALSHGDEALADRTVRAYVAHIEASVLYYEELSRVVFGREIPQILLLHANRLNADNLDRVVDFLEDRGYELASLETATSDPVYARVDSYVGPRGLSWLQRWALDEGVRVPDEPREDPWVAEALRRAQHRP